MKGFCTADNLWVYDREKSEVRKSRPKTVAVKKGFYAVQGPDGARDYAEVERGSVWSRPRPRR